MSNFITYVLPALIGAVAALLSVWLTTRFQTKKEANDTATTLALAVKTDATDLAIATKDDAIALRESLMEERKQLVDEIRALQDRCDLLEKENLRKCPLKELEDLQGRCDALEKTNQEQAAELLTLKEQNSQLIHEIKNFGSGLAEIKGVS
jgi:cell division protein FtsB